MLSQEPDWDSLPATTSAALRKLLARCLEKRPENRLRDVGDAALELKDVTLTALEESVSEPVRGGSGRTLGLLVSIAAMAAAIAGLAGWSLRGSWPAVEQPVVRSTLSVAPSSPIEVGPWRPDLAITRDGRVVVYRAEGGIYRRAVGELEGEKLPGSEGAVGLFLSPDGEWVGYQDASDHSLRKLPLEGGSPVVLAPLSDFLNGASWSDDNTIILGTYRTGLYRVPADGGELEMLLEVGSDEFGIRWPDLLPDGETVLFTSVGDVGWEAHVLLLATGERRLLRSRARYAMYVPSGHLLYEWEGTMYGVAFDPETLEMRGNAVQILDRVLAKGTGSVDFDVADDGSLVYASRALAGAPKRTLVWVDRAGREELLRLAPTSYTNPRLSGGEPRLAVEYEGDIWVWDLDRLTHNRLTISPAHDSRPLWTSDGDVLFSSLRRGWWDIYRKAADGTGGREATHRCELDSLSFLSLSRRRPSPLPRRPSGRSNQFWTKITAAEGPVSPAAGFTIRNCWPSALTS